MRFEESTETTKCLVGPVLRNELSAADVVTVRFRDWGGANIRYARLVCSSMSINGALCNAFFLFFSCFPLEVFRPQQSLGRDRTPEWHSSKSCFYSAKFLASRSRTKAHAQDQTVESDLFLFTRFSRSVNCDSEERGVGLDLQSRMG